MKAQQAFAILNREQINSVLADTHDLWGEGAQLIDRQQAFHFYCDTLGSKRLNMVGFVEDDSCVVASLKRYHFSLCSGRDPELRLRVLGIGAVFTHPQWRRRGLAAELLRGVLAQAQSEGYDAAMLYSDIDPGFYEALGFQQAPAWVWHADAAALFPSARPLNVRQAQRQESLQLLQYWEQSWPASGWWRFDRNIDQWPLLRTLNTEPDDYILFDDTGRACGYLALNFTGSGVRVGEWACAEHERLALMPRVWATVRSLAPLAARVMTWHRPDDAQYLEKIQPGLFVQSRRAAEIPMFAPLSERFDWHDKHGEASYFGIFDHI